MTNLDSRQHAYLKMMGIDVWLSRDAAILETAPEEIAQAAAVANDPPRTATVIDEAMTTSVAPVVADEVATLDWEALQARVAQCALCELHASRTQTVFGVGNPEADLLIIGEAPGADEDRQGEPFVGRAGQLLNAMLNAIGLARQEVYIANILKCRPPNNRDPKPEEAALCSPYLYRQIELIKPKLILALGRIAAQRLLQSNTSLGRLRGKVHCIEATTTPIIVTYHPAYLLRSPLEKRKAWEDLQFAVRTLEQGTSQ